MLNDLELMRVHARALFIHNAESRLLFVNEPGGSTARASRLFFGRTRIGNLWRFRADIAEDLIRELDSLCADEPPANNDFNKPPRHIEEYLRLLESHAPVESVSIGPAYHFSENIVRSRNVVSLMEDDAEKLEGGFEELVAELPTWRPFVAFIEDNRAVSVCRSARITPEAHEAGVETLPEFRGRGYAKDVVAEWAQRVRAMGAVPLYSTSWENNASQAVARKLGLECYGADFQIT